MELKQHLMPKLKALRLSGILDTLDVRTREANGRELSYIEGWYAVSEANRIFEPPCNRRP